MTSKATAPENPTPEQGVGLPPHHPFGPSRWPALLVCPHYSGKPGGADAEHGTALHARFAAILNGETVTPPADVFEENTDILATDLKALAGDAELYVEQTVHLPAPPGESARDRRIPCFGRLDLSWFAKAGDALHLHVVDFKMVENPDRDYLAQLVAYGVGMMEKTGLEPDRIFLHVAYCDTCHDSTMELSRTELLAQYADAYHRVSEVESGEAFAEKPRQSGWCALCEKMASCPAMLSVVEAVKDGGSLASVPNRWPELSGEEKARYLVVAEQVAKWAETVKSHAAEDAKAGVEISDPDNGIYYVLRNRSGKLVPEFFKTWELFKSHDLTQDDFIGCLDVSLSKAKNILCAKAWMKMADANAAMETCGTRGKPSVALVRKGA